MTYGEKGACGKLINCKWSFDDLCQLGDRGKTELYSQIKLISCRFLSKTTSKRRESNRTWYGQNDPGRWCQCNLNMLSIDKYRVRTRWQAKTNRMTNPHMLRRFLYQRKVTSKTFCAFIMLPCFWKLVHNILFLEGKTFQPRDPLLKDGMKVVLFWALRSRSVLHLLHLNLWIWLDVEHIL